MRAGLAILLVSAGAGAGHAAPAIELGAALGGHAFSDDVELGVTDGMNEPGPTSAALLGVRVGYQFARQFAAEGEAMVIPTEDDVLGTEATVYGLRAHVRFDVLTGRVRPFVVAGIGMHMVRGGAPQMNDDTDRAYHWGGGARYALSPRVDLRLDLRHLVVPDRTVDGATSDFEVSLGATYRFGRAQRRVLTPTVVAHAPPQQPPLVDTDGDGAVDRVDLCPEKAEDRDGWQDDDGCPDLDNDDDGVVDLADTCPQQAETRNNWQDHDGCPDQVIVELAGINFEHGSARIDAASGPLLEKAYQILRDNPSLHVEVAGHTSMEGNPDRNFDLSLRRAQAVKEHLVRRGIPASRVLSVGHGSEVPVGDNNTDDGRKKNRRIEFRILRPDELMQ